MNAFYAWSAILLTLLSVVLFGLAFTMLVYRWREKKVPDSLGEKDITGCLIGGLSMGCPVCGSLLLPALGVVGGLSIFPLQGLELKLAAIFLFGLSIIDSSRAVAGKAVADDKKEKLVSFEQGSLVLNFNRKALVSSLPILIPILVLFLILALPLLPSNLKINFAKKGVVIQSSPLNQAGSQLSGDAQATLDQINPKAGYEIEATFNNLGPQLIEIGAIDLDKFKKVYQDGGQPLTEDEINILTRGSQQKVKITSANAHFLLNFFWALGLANKNSILDTGPMISGGTGDLGNFASTGGWTLGKKKATELYSKSDLIGLNSGQQKILEEFAYNSYRPCCSNPTAFPDCNHGMAALGLGELMASQGASKDEIFEAFKYFNSFWFPQTYFDVANYFKAKDGQDWSQVPGSVVAGKDYSTPQGWQRVRGWLKDQGLLQETPNSGGGGCGA